MPLRPMPGLRVFIGDDAAERRACDVAMYSLFRYASRSLILADRLSLHTLRDRYTRPTTTLSNGQLHDTISDAPMSTAHAIARFFVPLLCEYTGWAVFTDGDVLFRDDIQYLFTLADPKYAIQVVQHAAMESADTKKSGHIQQPYPRKNWSSVMLWNCGHLSNRQLTLDVLNGWPGRDLHAFRWLRDDQIGALPARWNHLVGVSPADPDPAIVHYTLGTPDLEGHQGDLYAADWIQASRVAGHGLPTAFLTEIGG